MAEEEFIELKFRLYDGSDIGPIRYAASSTITMVKERILSEWPKGAISFALYIFNFLIFTLIFSVHLTSVWKLVASKKFFVQFIDLNSKIS